MEFGRKDAYIVSFVLLAVAALLVIVTLRRAETNRWDAMTRRLDQLRTEAESRKTPRSVFGGAPVEGKAWDEYERAINEMLSSAVDDGNGGMYAQFANNAPEVDRTQVERMVAGRAQVLEHLRLGAQLNDGQYPYFWSDGTIPSLLGSRKVANLAAAQAAIWTSKGRTTEAADLLLDLTVFAHDLRANAPLLSTLIGLAVYSTAFDGLRNLLLSGTLNTEQLADLERKLEIVDREFSSMNAAFSSELLTSGIGMQQFYGQLGSPGELWGRLKEGGWQLAVFPRRIIVDAFHEMDASMHRSAQLDRMKPADAKREAAAIEAGLSASSNIVVLRSVPSLARSFLVHQEALARLRLLRAATGFLIRKEMPAAGDPLGDKLLFEKDATTTKFWSIGRDGTDDSGAGDWSKGQPDLVLELPIPLKAADRPPSTRPPK